MICPNCGRAFQAQGAEPECPRCHYRNAPPSYAPAMVQTGRGTVAASTYSLPPPDPALVAPLPPQRAWRSQSTNGMAVAALVVGIVGLVMWPLSLVALTLGIMGKVQTNKTGQPGGGLAVAGIVLGSIVIVIGITIMAVLFIAFGL